MSQQAYGTERTRTFQRCALPVCASTLATAVRSAAALAAEVAGHEDAVAVRGDGVCVGDVDVGGTGCGSNGSSAPVSRSIAASAVAPFAVDAPEGAAREHAVAGRDEREHLATRPWIPGAQGPGRRVECGQVRARPAPDRIERAADVEAVPDNGERSRDAVVVRTLKVCPPRQHPAAAGINGGQTQPLEPSPFRRSCRRRTRCHRRPPTPTRRCRRIGRHAGSTRSAFPWRCRRRRAPIASGH